MKVSKLIEKLSAMNPDAKVMTYIDEEECYGTTTEVILVEEGNERPYAKGDAPEGTFVLISGWRAS
jgi:hypothetical protein